MTMMVIGSPERGLVGIGRGRGSTTILALDSAYHKGMFGYFLLGHKNPL